MSVHYHFQLAPTVRIKHRAPTTRPKSAPQTEAQTGRGTRRGKECGKECGARHSTTHQRGTANRLRPWVTLLWAGSITVSQPVASAVHASRLDHSIYVCMQEDGGPLYTDRGCLHGPKLHLAPTNVYHTQQNERRPGESAHSKQLDPDHSTKSKAKLAAQRTAQLRERQAVCQKAQKGLDRLHTKRRKGYRLSESRSLDQLEEELHAQRKAAC